jgi:hypothetical protein
MQTTREKLMHGDDDFEDFDARTFSSKCFFKAINVALK